MAKPKSRPQLSFDTAYSDDNAAGIPEEHWSRLFFEQIVCAFDDAQFADLYQERGRYPVSPSLLACLTILQYMFRVTDRAAVENTIMRRDWRIALGIRSDYEGFDPSVLCRFRQRLVAHGRLREIFRTVLRRLRELGLLAGRRRLRVDATHVIADVARLSRAEMIQEAIRIVVCDAYRRYPKLRQSMEFMQLYEAYGEEVWIGGGSSGEEKLTTLGQAGYRLLALCGEREVKKKDVLARILDENFIMTDEEGPKPRAPDERPGDHVVTPHDPDVQSGRERDKKWLGDKAHFVETADVSRPNFVTDAMVTGPRAEDSTMLSDIAQRSRFGMSEAETLIADGGYASARNSRELAGMGLELISPPRGNNRRGKLPLTDFSIDFEQQVAVCPEGHESVVWSPRGRMIYIRFAAETCAKCPRRSECTDSKQGRTLAPSRDYEQLLRDRARAETEEFKALYRLRAPIEATISELVHCCGLRRSRYRGAPFRALHVLLSATALNVRRMLRCLADQQTQPQAVASALLSIGRHVALRVRRSISRTTCAILTRCSPLVTTRPLATSCAQ